jgi:hypothetical protein
VTGTRTVGRIALSPVIPAPPPQHRWGASRSVTAFAALDGDLVVGEMWIVSDGDPCAGLIVWVSVPDGLRGRGYGLAIHEAVAQKCGPLLLDTFALGTRLAYDGVSLDELGVWDRMVRSSDWHVGFAAGGKALYATYAPTGGAR